MQNELTKLGSSLRNGTTEASAAVKPLDAMIQRLHTLKRKMESLHEEEQVLHEASRRRLSHLNDLYEMNSLADVKYDEWSAVRLDRLLVEYMVRQGYSESARALAREKGIEELVDLGVFDRCEKVRRSLRGGSLDECLAWCAEYKVVMKKTDTSLEFELRLQQYIELCRQDRFVEARDHAKKYFPQYHEGHQEKICVAASLLAFKPDRRQHVCTRWVFFKRTSSSLTYLQQMWYSQSRWDELAALFIDTHHQLFSLPSQPLLLIALSAGLSALKTPSCHSKHASSTANASSTTTSVCPICSTELNELARKLPYAHHTKSYVENDPVVLVHEKEGRVYGRDRLLEYCKKIGLEEGFVKDPTSLHIWPASELKKVYIS